MIPIKINTQLSYAYDGDAGFDIPAKLDFQRPIHPGKTVLIPTGIKAEIPHGWQIEIRSRSGLASKGIHVLNSPGTVDSGFRGEWLIILHNASEQTYYVKDGDRIAQGVLMPVYRVEFQLVDEIDENTERGKKGYGSSGI